MSERVLTLPLSMYEADLQNAKDDGKREVMKMLTEILWQKNMVMDENAAWKKFYDTFDTEVFQDVYDKNLISDIGQNLFGLKLEDDEK